MSVRLISVSPLMGPILSITFGLSIGDSRTIHKGMRNELVGIMISLITGLIMGFFASLYYHPDYRSDEMVNRGEGEMNNAPLCFDGYIYTMHCLQQVVSFMGSLWRLLPGWQLLWQFQWEDLMQ